MLALYATVYRFLLYRLPILYAWKTQPQEAEVREAVRVREPVLRQAKSSAG